MLTIITGTPGAGKSLYTVWEEARKVPGSSVESNGVAVPRRLLSNIKDLLLEHEVIGAKELETWHEWARPGDVIIFDEVQEVWRPRSFGTKVPECIAALETHRHKGVDIILITQHPMLVDPNIRRLCNRHLHLRRLARTVAYVYEWDHCANPGQVKTAIQARVWFHPKKAYALYKSAQLHTKPTARVPRLALVGLAAAALFAYVAPMAYGRVTKSLGMESTPVATAARPAASAPKKKEPEAGLPAPAPFISPVLQTVSVSARPEYLGCIKFGPRCECFGDVGQRVQVEPATCDEGSHRVGFLMPAGHGQRAEGYPTAQPNASTVTAPAPRPGASASPS